MPAKQTKPERERRDALILRMFIQGHSSRAIAQIPEVGLTHQRVLAIIKRELDDTAEHVKLLSKEALSMHLQRQEMLLAKFMPKALKGEGDVKSAEYCRRLLSDQARFWGLTSVEGDQQFPHQPGLPIDDGEERKAAGESAVTKLDAYRRRHR
jgi:hypothetical protein